MSVLSATQVMERYMDEHLPEFSGMELTDVNQKGIFGNTPLHVACVRGEIEEVLPLLTAGANVDALGEFNSTPLHDAVAQGHEKVVKLLLERGASTNTKNEFGESPKDVAARKKNVRMIGILSGD